MADLTQPPQLLTDEEVLGFVVRGYLNIKPGFPDEFNESICEQLDRVNARPGVRILEAVPMLQEVYDHPVVRGALTSILGEDYRMNRHRTCHTNPAGSQSGSWHQDGTNVRHHQVWCVLAMYFPHDVPPEMGPTVLMPGSHLRNAPSDRLQTYANIKGQVALAVEAGTVSIASYDIWHAASMNRTERPRYMLKFLFDRQSDTRAPAWNHDPETMDVKGHISELVGAQGYSSDYHKEWELRTEMWQWFLGNHEPVPPGAFKDMLGA